jgi:hypothetical protein
MSGLRHGEGLGLALFIRRGITAWMQAWSECVGNGEAAVCAPSGFETTVRATLRGQIAQLLAGMMLSLQHEATA